MNEAQDLLWSSRLQAFTSEFVDKTKKDANIYTVQTHLCMDKVVVAVGRMGSGVNEQKSRTRRVNGKHENFM